VSGFLQRVASGVLHAERAIHPSLGTIWSAAGMTGTGMMEPPGTAEPIESSGAVLAPPPPRGADASAPAATQQSTQQPAKPQMQPERNAPHSESASHADAEQPAIAETVTFKPLVGSPQRRAVANLPPALQANATTQHSRARPPPSHPVTSPEHSGLQQSTRPLVPAPPIPVSAMAGAGKAPSFLPPSQHHPQPAQSVAEEPESIEIHIGRIEVLAAPSRPAQTAVPRSARKSLDLVEYLGRERRSR
jgi:hypothetical protein